MPWDNTPAGRAASAKTYSDPEYLRNKAIAKRRADGRCEGCHHPHTTLQCDHDIPVSQGGSHHHSNLKMRCKGPGTCRCHDRKTAQEGGGYRKPASDPPPRPATTW